MALLGGWPSASSSAEVLGLHNFSGLRNPATDDCSSYSGHDGTMRTVMLALVVEDVGSLILGMFESFSHHSTGQSQSQEARQSVQEGPRETRIVTGT